MITDEDVMLHKQIKDVIDARSKVGKCFSSEYVAKTLDVDKSVVEKHLELMIEDELLIKPDDVDLYCDFSALDYMISLLEKIRYW